MFFVIMISRLFFDVKYFFGGKKGIVDILNSNLCREDEKKIFKNLKNCYISIFYRRCVCVRGGGGNV